jgi:hypothetical protein
VVALLFVELDTHGSVVESVCMVHALLWDAAGAESDGAVAIASVGVSNDPIGAAFRLALDISVWVVKPTITFVWRVHLEGFSGFGRRAYIRRCVVEFQVLDCEEWFSCLA